MQIMPNFAVIMWELLIDIIVIWLVYKLVFDFIVPVYQSTKQVKKQMQDIHRQMENAYRQSAPPRDTPGNTPPPPAAGKKEGEYIEFEEVKSS